MSDIVDLEKMEKGWRGGLPETPCGFGSTLQATEKQRAWIPQIVRKYKIKSIADIGAGDMNWVQHMKLPKTVEYSAFDYFPRRPEVQKFDLLKQIPPAVDMLMCLWVLNHLSKDLCLAAINNLKASGAKYLLMTDRPIWHREQPAEIQMPFVESLNLTDKGDRIILCPI